MSAFRLKLMVMLLAAMAIGTGLIGVTGCDYSPGSAAADKARLEEQKKQAEKEAREAEARRDRAERQRDTVENSRFRWVVIACTGTVIALLIGTGMRYRLGRDLRRQRAGLADTEQSRGSGRGA